MELREAAAVVHTPAEEAVLHTAAVAAAEEVVRNHRERREKLGGPRKPILEEGPKEERIAGLRQLEEHHRVIEKELCEIDVKQTRLAKARGKDIDAPRLDDRICRELD